MRIAFFETKPWEQEYLSKKLSGFELAFYDTTKNVRDEKAEVLCIFIGFKIDQNILENFPALKYICTRSTGYDHIDLKACAQKNIAISNVPTYGENTVAEFTFALLLALTRKLYPSLKRIKEEALFNCDGLCGMDLMGKTLGVVGTGHIGTYVVKIANGFGMHVIAYDPYPKAELAKQFNFEYVEMEKLLSNSDIITLHVPYTHETHHLLNMENIKKVKKGALLINTARGGLVETEALVWALSTGALAGAGLDVLEEEGYIKEEADLLVSGHHNEQQLKTLLADHILMNMPSVLITPHNAFNAKEALTRILDTTISNIHSFEHDKIINLVK
jgi:D-lactate dehydrogenase